MWFNAPDGARPHIAAEQRNEFQKKRVRSAHPQPQQRAFGRRYGIAAIKPAPSMGNLGLGYFDLSQLWSTFRGARRAPPAEIQSRFTGVSRPTLSSSIRIRWPGPSRSSYCPLRKDHQKKTPITNTSTSYSGISRYRMSIQALCRRNALRTTRRELADMPMPAIQGVIQPNIASGIAMKL